MRRFHHLRKFIQHNRFLVVIAAAIGISILLVVISVTIYVRDGVLLLDLSRPSYAPVREKIKKDDGTPGFSASGSLSKEVIEDFYTQLRTQAGEIEKLGNFDSKAINDSTLQLTP